MIAAFVAAQTVLVPILGLIWLGIRSERQKQQRLYNDAIALATQRQVFTRKH